MLVVVVVLAFENLKNGWFSILTSGLRPPSEFHSTTALDSDVTPITTTNVKNLEDNAWGICMTEKG